MNNIKDIRVVPLTESIYVRPKSLLFNQDGKEKKWDFLTLHPRFINYYSMALIEPCLATVYAENVSKYESNLETIDPAKYPAKLGITIELCAGIVDKDVSLEQIAKEEIHEECGYDVPIANIKKIKSFRSSVGTNGSLQTMFYCEVTDEMKVSEGGGIHDEIIEVVEMTVKQIQEYIEQDSIDSPAGFLFAYYWFLVKFPQFS